ncbi:hypothetical protein B0H21DRAFT_730076 [Amylocystis lapponica]|nr:hypothetical protein B0H21DRAFT_730076 [Amylocystis lapponica]
MYFMQFKIRVLLDSIRIIHEDIGVILEGAKAVLEYITRVQDELQTVAEADTAQHGPCRRLYHIFSDWHENENNMIHLFSQFALQNVKTSSISSQQFNLGRILGCIFILQGLLCLWTFGILAKSYMYPLLIFTRACARIDSTSLWDVSAEDPAIAGPVESGQHGKSDAPKPSSTEISPPPVHGGPTDISVVDEKEEASGIKKDTVAIIASYYDAIALDAPTGSVRVARGSGSLSAAAVRDAQTGWKAHALAGHEDAVHALP